MRVSELCSIQMGYTTRGKLGASDDGCLVIQLKDAPIAGRLKRGTLARLQLDDIDDRYAVSEGDIIFRSRGEYPAAFVLDQEWKEPAVAVYPFMILRADTSKVLPDFMAWSINQAPAQHYFKREQQGTNIMAVNKVSLAGLDIDVPCLEVQSKIMNLVALQDHEASLLHKLAETKSRMTTAFLLEKAAQSG